MKLVIVDSIHPINETVRGAIRSPLYQSRLMVSNMRLDSFPKDRIKYQQPCHAAKLFNQYRASSNTSWSHVLLFEQHEDVGGLGSYIKGQTSLKRNRARDWKRVGCKMNDILRYVGSSRHHCRHYLPLARQMGHPKTFSVALGMRFTKQAEAAHNVVQKLPRTDSREWSGRPRQLMINFDLKGNKIRVMIRTRALKHIEHNFANHPNISPGPGLQLKNWKSTLNKCHRQKSLPLLEAPASLQCSEPLMALTPQTCKMEQKIDITHEMNESIESKQCGHDIVAIPKILTRVPDIQSSVPDKVYVLYLQLYYCTVQLSISAAEFITICIFVDNRKRFCRGEQRP